jgi:ammonium transporter Rh
MDVYLKNKNQTHKQEKTKKYALYYFFIFLEIIIIVLYGLFTDYGQLGNPKDANSNTQESASHVTKYYAFFQDVHVMIFIGFGFLMTFLKSYSWSAVGFNFLLAAWVIQISILLNGLWSRVFNGIWVMFIEIDIPAIIKADFSAGTFLISFGAVLGKLNFQQLFVMATIETIFVSLVTTVGYDIFSVADIGGSMFIHTFGAYFGLAVAIIINNKSKAHYGNHKCGSGYNSNLFAMIGTIFLWMFWPSFNAALGLAHAQVRSIVNTYLSLTGSVFMVFMLNPLFKDGKFNMEDVLNASLAGGVIIGASADLIIHPWISLLVGCIAGTISTIGFEKLAPLLAKKINLHDTCGVHNLHGIPGFLGGIIAFIISGTASIKDYGDSFSILWPKILEWGNSKQAGYQLAALFLVLGTAIITGIITGLIINASCFGEIEPFEDNALWFMEEEEKHHILPSDRETPTSYDKVIPTEKELNTIRD